MLEIPVSFASRQDIGHQDGPLSVVNDVEHPPATHAKPPAVMRIISQGIACGGRG